MAWSRLLLVAAVIGLSAWAEEPFDYFDNSWSVIGLKDYARGTRITPDNRLMVGTSVGTDAKEADKASVRIRFGRDPVPLGREQTKVLKDGWLPVNLLTAQDGPVRYEFTMWATPLPSVKDWRKAFDWPVDGDNFLNWVAVRVVNAGDAAGEGRLRFEQAGEYESAKHPVPSLATPREFSWTLEPGKAAECFVAIPWEPVKDADYAQEDPKLWLDRTIEYWRGVMAGAASIRVPDEKATQALLAAHVCQLIAGDHGEIHGGEGFYDEFYIRDGAYQVMELEEAGLWDAARNAIKAFTDHQRNDGRFETQKGQLDANGQALWALWQYWQITGDDNWAEQVYPQMLKAVKWTTTTLSHGPADSPFELLLPAAPADGESLWDGKHHILGYDFWNLRGMLCTADVTAALGKADEADMLRKEAAAYREAIDKAGQRTGLAHFPPSWEKEGTHWGDTETLWPTPIFPADDARVTASLKEVRENHLGGFAEGTIRWTDGKMEPAIHPYMSVYSTMASLVRGEDEKVVDEFYWYLLHSTATHAFPEGIFFKRRFAWSNTIPHGTGASNYALLLRHMLVHEQGNELHLLKAIPDWWLDNGNEIVIKHAPTHFGPISLRVKGTVQGVQVTLDKPQRKTPKRIVLHLPQSRSLENACEGVEVAARGNQSVRYDFPGVIARYCASRQ
jgi:GH15 family glucan-1,4-alpha-glucosidase